MTKREPRPSRRVSAGGTGFLIGGAEGIRTPDLLIANETRYQLRHSPMRLTARRQDTRADRAVPNRPRTSGAAGAAVSVDVASGLGGLLGRAGEGGVHVVAAARPDARGVEVDRRDRTTLGGGLAHVGRERRGHHVPGARDG